MTEDSLNNAAPEAAEDTATSAAQAAAEAAEAQTPQADAAEGAAGAKDAESAQAADDAESIVDEAEAVVAEADRVALAEAEAAAMRDKYLRLQADWDNFRKRTAEEAADQRLRATERLMNDVLPVLDDFERAIDHAANNGEAGMLDGVRAIGTKLADILTKHGLEAIDPAGEAFDALEHQAVATVPDESVPDETVAQVYQKGYRMGKKVLRPAMVTISSGGPKRESEPDAANEEK